MDNIVVEKFMFFNYNYWRPNIRTYLIVYNQWDMGYGMPNGGLEKIWEMK